MRIFHTENTEQVNHRHENHRARRGVWGKTVVSVWSQLIECLQRLGLQHRRAMEDFYPFLFFLENIRTILRKVTQGEMLFLWEGFFIEPNSFLLMKDKILWSFDKFVASSGQEGRFFNFFHVAITVSNLPQSLKSLPSEALGQIVIHAWTWLCNKK